MKELERDISNCELSCANTEPSPSGGINPHVLAALIAGGVSALSSVHSPRGESQTSAVVMGCVDAVASGALGYAMSAVANSDKPSLQESICIGLGAATTVKKVHDKIEGKEDTESLSLITNLVGLPSGLIDQEY